MAYHAVQGGRILETLTIRGGRPLRGTLAVQGSKNAVLPILAAAAAVPGRFSHSNCPPIRDVAVTRGILEGLGLSTSEAGGLLHIDSSGPVATAPDPRLAGRLRSSVLLLGALLARNGAAEVPLPGGCVLGTRPLDLHLRSLEALGVQFRCEDGDTIMLGETELRFMLTPGHTMGSGCYLTDECIFSGDTLFCTSVGRTDFPTSSMQDMMQSVERLKNLEGDYRVYPGHDMFTSLERERKHNPFMR